MRRLSAQWSDILKTYNIDSIFTNLRFLTKITESHVMPGKIRKIKVVCSAQVFSHSFAATMNLIARAELATKNRQKLSPTATETAELLKKFDTLFGSVNGSTVYPKAVLLCHRSRLKTLGFLAGSKEKPVKNVSCLKNWVITLNGLEDLHMSLKNNFNIKDLKTRAINQDPLENFFGQMHQHGYRNVNPNVTQFAGNFKALLLNNMVTRHSLGANCEDDSTKMLANQKDFLIGEENTENAVNTQDSINNKHWRNRRNQRKRNFTNFVYCRLGL